MTFTCTVSATSESYGVDAPCSLATRSMTLSVLALQTSLLWPPFHDFVKVHRSLFIVGASDFFTDLASNVNIIRAILNQVSSFSMQVQNLFLATAANAVWIIPPQGSITDPCGGVKRWSIQLFRGIRFSVLCMCCGLSQQVNIHVGQVRLEILGSERVEGQSTSVNLEPKFG